MNKKNKIQTSTSRKVFMICDYALMLLITLICIYPFWYIIIYTFSEGSQVDVNPPVFLPRGFTLSNYKDIFELKGFFHSVLISVLRTVIGTVASVLSCSFLGYLFTKEEMPFRKFLYRFLILTMYISGGMIASYIVMKSYGLLNNFWVYILPTMISAYNIVLIKTFVEQLPASLEESARLDGAGYLTVFTKLILPLSKPIIANVAVFVAVGQWNSWFDNHIYTRGNDSLTTLQICFIITSMKCRDWQTRSRTPQMQQV
ncbi:MAG: carbohydrate ABC transporter permease [Lachnospiraceae bacterium]